MDEANRCDRVALVQRGRVLAIDTPAAITASFGRPLLAVRTARRYAALRALDAYPHRERAYAFGDVLHLTDSRPDAAVDDIAHEASAFLRAHGIADADVSAATPTIEDAFIARMGAPEGEAERDSRGAA